MIYRSFCVVKTFLNSEIISKFDEIFDFEIFLIIEDELKESISFEENFKGFELNWKLESD